MTHYTLNSLLGNIFSLSTSYRDGLSDAPLTYEELLQKNGIIALKNNGDEYERRTEVGLSSRINRESKKSIRHDTSRHCQKIRDWRCSSFKMGNQKRENAHWLQNSFRINARAKRRPKNTEYDKGNLSKIKLKDLNLRQKTTLGYKLSIILSLSYYNPIINKDKDYKMYYISPEVLKSLPQTKPTIIDSEEVKERLTDKLDGLTGILDALASSDVNNPNIFSALSTLTTSLRDEAEFVEGAVDDMFNLLGEVVT